MNSGTSRTESGQTMHARSIRDRLPPEPFTLAQAMRVTGRDEKYTHYFLNQTGYRARDGGYAKRQTAMEIEDAINARRAALPVSSGPCFRCGGARVCVCRS